MLLYVGIMLACLSVGTIKFRNRLDKRVTLAFCLFVLFALVAFRGESVGNDTKAYIEIFNRVKQTDTWYDPTHRFEFGYQIFCRLIIIFFGHHQFLFIISAIICACCLYVGLKDTSLNIGFSLFLFVALRMFYFYLSGLRQAMAMSIIFASYKLIKKELLLIHKIKIAPSFQLKTLFLFLINSF